MNIELLNGAFQAYQENGKWFYKANIDKIGAKKPKPLSLKEQPQYKQIVDIEENGVEQYNQQNRKMVIEIATFLNSL